VLVSKLFRAGESLTLNGAAPLQVKVGNAHGTELQFRGRSVDLTATGSRDNVARLELK
jgi:cytoskeleton protein RodZ